MAGQVRKPTSQARFESSSEFRSLLDRFEEDRISFAFAEAAIDESVEDGSAEIRVIARAHGIEATAFILLLQTIIIVRRLLRQAGKSSNE